MKKIFFALFFVLFIAGCSTFSPGSQLPERCNVKPGFACSEFILDNNGEAELAFILVNQEGVTLSSFDVKSIKESDVEIENTCTTDFDERVLPGDTVTITCRGIASSSWERDMKNFDVDVVYTPLGRSLERDLTVSLYLRT